MSNSDNQMQPVDTTVEHIELADAFVTLDREWRYTYLNERAVELLGRPREELLGQVVWELFPGTVGELTYRELQRAMNEHVPVSFEYSYTATGLWYENRAFPTVDGLAVFFNNITPRKQAELALRMSEQRYRFLANLSQILGQLAEPKQIERITVECVAKYLDVDRCYFAQTDGAQVTVYQEFRRDAVSLIGTYTLAEFIDLEMLQLLRTGVTIAVADVATDSHTIARVANYHQVDIAALIIMPIFYQGRWIGTFNVANREPRVWRDDEVELLRDVAARAWPQIEQTRSVRALNESELRFRQLAESLPQFVWISGADGVIEYVNTQWAEYSGLSIEQTRDPGVLASVIHPDDAPGVFGQWEQAQINKSVYESKARMLRTDGVYRWFLIRSIPLKNDWNIVNWFGASTDIHDQEELRSDSQFLADLAEQIRLANDPDMLAAEVVQMIGTYLGVSRCYLTEVDLPHQRFIVRHEYNILVRSITGEHRFEDYPDRMFAVLASGRMIVATNTKTDPDTAAMYDHGYESLGVRALLAVPFLRDRIWRATLAATLDVPRIWQPREVRLLETTAERLWLAIEKLRTDAALRVNEERLQILYAQEQLARQQAEAANRLKDDFLATVSHELRTPLTSILGYGQLLQSRKRDEAYTARTVDRIVRSAEAQAQLIEDLLDVSRIVAGKLRLDRRILNMTAVIQTSIDTLRPALEAKALRLELELPPVVIILGDPNRLQQVVWNLLANAAKFTPNGGAVRVSLQFGSGVAELVVSDTGQGIPIEFLPYVFDRFRQADSASNRAFGGLGLGLSIVHHLVELHEGTVHVESAGPGTGTTFTVRLPLLASTDEAEPRKPRTTWQYLPQLAGLRLLVVDDQPDILDLIEEVFAPCGTTVRLCASAAEGLATLREWQPDVLISDIAMPGQDGYWLIGNVRALTPEEGGTIPAVALTAYVRLEERTRVLAAGFQMYVPKPIEPTELMSVVASLAAPV